MALEPEELERLLTESGALRRGHFRLSSGRHSSGYVQCARLLELPARARRVGAALAGRLAEARPESILSPALGGLVIGHEVAAALEVPFRFVERTASEGAEMELRRGFSLAPGERVAIVEDVVTTGRSTGETIAVAERLGALPVAVAAIIDRSRGQARFPVTFVSLLALDLEDFDPAACPLCRAGSAPEKPGSRPG